MEKLFYIALIVAFFGIANAEEQKEEKKDNKYLFSFSSDLLSYDYTKISTTYNTGTPGVGTVEQKTEQDNLHFAINPAAWNMYFGYKVTPRIYILGKFGFEINSGKVWKASDDRNTEYSFTAGPGIRFDMNKGPVVFYIGGTLCYSMSSDFIHLGVLESFGGLEIHINQYFSLGGKIYLQGFFGIYDTDINVSGRDPYVMGFATGMAFSASVYF